MMPVPACMATPGTVPQPKFFVFSTTRTGDSAVLEIGSEADFDVMSDALWKIVLVPAEDAIKVIQISPQTAHWNGEPTENGMVKTLHIPLGKIAPGNYRVLAEERDLDAPPGCPITFIVDVGNAGILNL